jgi:hypothetical protein
MSEATERGITMALNAWVGGGAILGWCIIGLWMLSLLERMSRRLHDCEAVLKRFNAQLARQSALAAREAEDAGVRVRESIERRGLFAAFDVREGMSESDAPSHRRVERLFCTCMVETARLDYADCVTRYADARRPILASVIARTLAFARHTAPDTAPADANDEARVSAGTPLVARHAVTR